MAKELERTFSPFDPVINYLGTGKGTRQILLMTHLDTVYPKMTLKQMPWKVENGLAFGPGVLDIKASYVIIYEVLKHFETDLHNGDWQLVWLNTGHEEIGSPSGKKFVLEEEKKVKLCRSRTSTWQWSAENGKNGCWEIYD